MTDKVPDLGHEESKRVADITNMIVREAQTLSPDGRKALVVCIFRRFKEVIDAMNTKKKGVKP